MANNAANANMTLNPKLVEKYNTHPEELGGKKRLDLTKSFQKFEEAKDCLPGGLTGVRNPKGMIEGEYPVFIERGMIGKAKAPTYAEDAKFIQVNMDSAMIGMNAEAEVGIVGGSGNVAKQLLAELQGEDIPKKDDWYREAKALYEEAMARYVAARTDEKSPMHPGRAAAEVAKFLDTEGRDWSMICDGGDVTHWAKNNFRAHVPGQILEKGPLGTIGSGAGYVMGAWEAHKTPVMYCTGDGSFGFHAMEFDTFAREGIPVVGVVFNDSSWGMIKMAEQSRHPEELKKYGPVGLVLAEERRYDLMPPVWGGKGFLITKPEEIIPAIKEIQASGLPGILNIIIDKAGISHVTEGFAKGLTVKKPE
ncbi:MAG: thiamine pyrophosphate-dependent enzyme [Bacillota bacterium]|nr:thiamine pyrophosphate-dependent enzyme [Bacillota bacterium]